MILVLGSYIDTFIYSRPLGYVVACPFQLKAPGSTAAAVGSGARHPDAYTSVDPRYAFWVLSAALLMGSASLCLGSYWSLRRDPFLALVKLT